MVLPEPTPLSLRHQLWAVSRPGSFAEWLRERHSPIASLRGNLGKCVVVVSAEGARHVFSADPAGYDPFWQEPFTGLAGKGSLWVLSGERHRQERQLLSSPTFHGRSYRSYGDSMRAFTESHLSDWQPGQTVRAIETTRAIALDVILRLVFGVTDEKPDPEGRNAISGIWHTMHPLIVFSPGLQRPWFPLWRRFDRARREFTCWAYRQIAERRARPGEAEDVLGRMVNSCYDDGTRMQDEDIRDELITILIAGHETTATALAWALYELGRHPAQLQRLRAELEGAGENADPDLVAKLPYLSAVCNETLRLHTLLAEVGRMCTAPVECLGYTIPAGHGIIISIVGIHHDPALYPEPDRFRPERFLERAYAPFEFLPFGGGHRRCLGAGLSDYEMRVVLAEIVMRWEFEPVGVERDIRYDIAMGPRHGVRLRLTARRPRATRAPGLRIEADRRTP